MAELKYKQLWQEVTMKSAAAVFVRKTCKSVQIFQLSRVCLCFPPSRISMHSVIQLTNKNLTLFNYIFPSIDLNFNGVDSQFIKSQQSLKLVNIVKQTAVFATGDPTDFL